MLNVGRIRGGELGGLLIEVDEVVLEWERPAVGEEVSAIPSSCCIVWVALAERSHPSALSDQLSRLDTGPLGVQAATPPRAPVLSVHSTPAVAELQSPQY
jgi:hypothetical protein